MDCLDSVARQTISEAVECILVDDCGKDKSLAIAKEFISNYKGNISFRLIERDNNGGLSAARNTGIRSAKGEYLYFLDSDDEITPTCLERMWKMIDQYGKVDLVQGSFFEELVYADSLSNIHFLPYTRNKKQIKSFLLQYLGDIVGAQSRLVRRDFLVNNNLYFEEGIIHEDNLWTFFLAKVVNTMAYCNVCTYYHRYNPNSITKNINIDKETFAYSFIIKTMCNHIDAFLSGTQKCFILEHLITVLNCQYYKTEEEKKMIVTEFLSICSLPEKILLKSYLMISSSFWKIKTLHMLLRIFKIKD